MAKKPTEKAEAKSAEPTKAVKAKKTTAKKTTTKKSTKKETKFNLLFTAGLLITGASLRCQWHWSQPLQYI